jgi:hypothetical protein
MKEIPDIYLEDVLKKIQDEIEKIKEDLIPSELLLNEIKNLKEAQQETKSDLKDIKKILLDPNDGVIVKVNKNTEFRLEEQESKKEYEEIVREHKDVISWKDNITKVMWIIVTAALSSFVYIFLNMN